MPYSSNCLEIIFNIVYGNGTYKCKLIKTLRPMFENVKHSKLNDTNTFNGLTLAADRPPQRLYNNVP